MLCEHRRYQNYSVLDNSTFTCMRYVCWYVGLDIFSIMFHKRTPTDAKNNIFLVAYIFLYCFPYLFCLRTLQYVVRESIRQYVAVYDTNFNIFHLSLSLYLLCKERDHVGIYNKEYVSKYACTGTYCTVLPLMGTAHVYQQSGYVSTKPD